MILQDFLKNHPPGCAPYGGLAFDALLTDPSPASGKAVRHCHTTISVARGGRQRSLVLALIFGTPCSIPCIYTVYAYIVILSSSICI